MHQFEFSSDKFPPYLPEDAQQNPGAYGFELADWLARELAKVGMVTSYPAGEDWGWFIEYSDGETEILIGCGSVSEEGGGYAGQPIDWRVFVRQLKTLKQRFTGAPTSAMVDKFAAAIEQVLRGAGIEPNK